jgi:hypothetical protein
MGNLSRSAAEMKALIQPPRAATTNEKSIAFCAGPSKYPITGSQSLLTAGDGLADSEREYEAVF